MGWKSTIALTRNHAISLIIERAMTASNQELLELVGYGDDTNLSLFGFNFTVLDTNEDVDRWNRDDYES